MVDDENKVDGEEAVDTGAESTDAGTSEGEATGSSEGSDAAAEEKEGDEAGE